MILPLPFISHIVASPHTHHRSARRVAATLYSLIQSAKRHGLDPFVYLRDLFLRIPTHPNKDIHLLLPDHWKRDTLPTLNLPPRP
jgi:hypothetical protein